MRKRKLSREQALLEYAMYKIRLFEFMNYSNVFIDICEGHYVPLNLIDAKDILRNVLIGLFYSLFDSNRDAINVFDMWIALHPELESQIVAVWNQIEPLAKVIKKYSGALTFHITNDPAEFALGWEAFWDKKFNDNFIEAQRQFLVLNKKLAELDSNPAFREGVKQALERDGRLSRPVLGASPPQTWLELVLKLAFRELDNPGYFQFRNPPGA